MLTMPAAAAPLLLTDEQRVVLDRTARSSSSRHRTVQRANIAKVRRGRVALAQAKSATQH